MIILSEWVALRGKGKWSAHMPRFTRKALKEPMPAYYVNPNEQANGDNEVHADGCAWLALVRQPVPLGNFLSCQEPVRIARQRYARANGCKHCSPQCHTT